MPGYFCTTLCSSLHMIPKRHFLNMQMCECITCTQLFKTVRSFPGFIQLTFEATFTLLSTLKHHNRIESEALNNPIIWINIIHSTKRDAWFKNCAEQEYRNVFQVWNIKWLKLAFQESWEIMKNVAFWKLSSIYENVFKKAEVISNIKNPGTSFKQCLTFGIPFAKIIIQLHVT